MASNGGEVNTDLFSSSPLDEHNFSSVFNHLTSPRNQTSESSEKSDNSLSDVEENVPREFELSEQYGRTPPSSRTFSKPSKERTKNSRRKKDKPGSEFRTSPSASWRRRQSASATSSERAFNRSVKEEESSVILVNGGEETPFKPRNRSFTESSLSRKPSQRKFQCIRYRESSFNVVNSVHFKENKAAVCPLERVKFYETMNMLMNLGQGGNAEGKENSVEETENYEIEELREALWLELQAWRNSTTMLNQDEWLMNERKKINTILDDVIYFNVDKTQQVNFDVLFSDPETDSEEDDDDEGCCVLHPSYSFVERSPSVDSETNDLAYYNESKLSTSSDLSGTISADEDTYKLSDFAQTIKTAVKLVSSTLDKLYSVEQLYPSHGALSKDFEKYTSEEFQTSCDTLVLWLNQIKGLYHKLHVMSWLVHVDFDDERVWKDWIDLGIDLNCLKTYNNCRNCQDLSSHCDFEMPENCESLKRGLSSDNTSTSRYRPFVDQNIKKMGVANLGYKLYQVIYMELARAAYILQVDKTTNAFLKHQKLHMLYKKMLVRKIENFQDKLYDPEDEETYTQTFGVPTENWIERFEKMGLPSFDSLYVFLVRLVMDIYHECLRMRMEHRPKGEPSSLSVRQLLEECKEVLLAAVVVRQYFLDALEGLGKDLSSSPQFEERVLEFDQDIQKMLEVYFEYLHQYMHILQRLPEASCGVKNILEEEWEFVREITPYIRGGEVQAGKRFCVMARGLVESTADFLATGMDEYFSGLHDLDDNEKHWVKVLQSCRDFKKLFQETRERSIKALAFIKRLRSDLGVAATFNVNVPYSELLEKLNASGYIQVVTKLNISVLMFVRCSLQESRRCIIELLNACCGLHSQSSACAKGMDNYIVLVSEKNTDGCQWTGDKINVTPALDASLGLVDMQVDELAIVACTSCALNIHINIFKAHMCEAVTCASGSTSCHLDLIDMKTQISDSLVNMRTKICDALDGAVENLDVEKMYDIEENERSRLNRSTLEALQFAFNAVFDFHREMRRIPEADEASLSIVGKYYLELASKWMDFVLKRCEKGKGSRPRWAGQGLKFLIEACHPTISCRLYDVEFEKLQHEINKCVDHVVGSADNLLNSSSPSTGSLSWSPNSRFLRSSTFPGTHSHVHPSRTISEPGRPTIKRANTTGTDPGEDRVDSEVPQRRITRVREGVAVLEYTRHTRMLDKRVIGRVSNKKRDLAGELAVIPKRVPFKWQRGNKIGEGQFGKVYACVNLDSEEVVAMKQITFHPNDHSAFQDLADEIKAFEGLTHDSLVKYYGCEVHRDVMYIFMEYCGDGTISDVSKLGLPEAMIRKYADQLLIAVEFLHDRGIVHRDIKGPNIFLSSEGLIKLGDFGASVKLVNPSQTMCGEVSTLRGTIAYMAPEVITLDKGAGYGRAADIWSVGCVVVEMATGKPPWSDYDNQWAIMLKVGEGGSPVIPECLSEEGKDFLMHCFVHDPHERWTARQLQNHTFLKV